MLKYYEKYYPRHGKFIQLWVRPKSGTIWSDTFKWEDGELKMYDDESAEWGEPYVDISEDAILLGYLQYEDDS